MFATGMMRSAKTAGHATEFTKTGTLNIAKHAIEHDDEDNAMGE